MTSQFNDSAAPVVARLGTCIDIGRSADKHSANYMLRPITGLQLPEANLEGMPLLLCLWHVLLKRPQLLPGLPCQHLQVDVLS